MLIEEPLLWTMYDKHYLVTNHTKSHTEFCGKVDAPCYYILNHLEIAYKASTMFSSQRKSWRNYFNELYEDSSAFRRATNYSIEKGLNSDEYLRFLKKNTEKFVESNE